jgi:hypothetical protein
MSGRPRLLFRVRLLFTILAAGTLSLAGTARAAVPLHWSAPVQIDSGVPFQAIACPSPSLCVAFDDLGQVATSTAPTDYRSWRIGHLLGIRAPVDVTPGLVCPSLSLCVAVDGSGGVWTSLAPATGAGSWTRTAVDPTGDGFTSLSCPAPTLCVAADGDGRILTSSNPSGGRSAWQVAQVEPRVLNPRAARAVGLLSCPSVSLCVGVDYDGILTSTNPASGAGAWTRAKVASGSSLEFINLSCPSAQLCVALNSDSAVVRSTAPTAGIRSWSLVRSMIPLGNVPVIFTCGGSLLCVADGDVGAIDTLYGTPAGQVHLATSSVDGYNDVTAIACPGPVECIALDFGGNLLVGDPAPPTVVVPRIIGANIGSDIGPTVTAQRTIDPRLRVACPRAGPQCTAAATLWVHDGERFVRVGSARLTIAAGHRRAFRVELTKAAVREVIKTAQGPFGQAFAQLFLSARDGHGAAVYDNVSLTINAPQIGGPTVDITRTDDRH